ncbi:MAG TPA: AraC family transcriptional regulator, partial [Acidobacteriota bacterium]|nr:AraC family transcriptional regulator [Acidobacteriota bacterium]
FSILHSQFCILPMLISLQLGQKNREYHSTGFRGQLGRQSHILIGQTSRQFHWSGLGCLSIKTFSQGTAYYNAGNGHFAVDDSRYLVLNENQPYTITIDVARPMSSFCLFFEVGLLGEIAESRQLTTESLLENPEGRSLASIAFFEKTYPHDDLLSPALRRLQYLVNAGVADPGILTEQMYGIAGRLLAVHSQTVADVEQFPAVRPATRDELYRRLTRARDFILARFDLPLTLADIAQVACLSPNHLLRTFKQAFQMTPHQMLTSTRLEAAKRLLKTTHHSVTEICLMVGFESLGSFSWLFRNKVGCSPDTFRKK